MRGGSDPARRPWSAHQPEYGHAGRAPARRDRSVPAPQGLCGHPPEGRRPRGAGDREVPGRAFREGHLEARVHEDAGSGAWRVQVLVEGRPLKWWQAIADLTQRRSASLARLLSEVLSAAPFETFYWECAPVSRSGDEDFEFVVMDAPKLRRRQADPSPFSTYLDPLFGQGEACAFANLGGDALLVAPANATRRPADYVDLAAFVRRAPARQVEKTWAELGRAIASTLEEHETVWVNTDGSSVAWLHLRLDVSPKYYKWSPYRRAQHEARRGAGRHLWA